VHLQQPHSGTIMDYSLRPSAADRPHNAYSTVKQTPSDFNNTSLDCGLALHLLHGELMSVRKKTQTPPI